MSIETTIAIGMFLVPVFWCLGQIFIPLLKILDRKGWVIFGAVLAWYLVAFAILNWGQP